MVRHKLLLLAGVVVAPAAWYGLGALAMGSSGPPWVPPSRRGRM